MIEERNAIITGTAIDTERGLSAWIYLDYGGSGQGFGGYMLYSPPSWTSFEPKGGNYAGHFLHRCIQIAGVERWEQLKGKTIRVKASHDKVHAIGHIVKDDWFDPTKDFEKMSNGKSP